MNESHLNIDDQKRKMPAAQYDHYYYGHGKLLLSGEYFVLDGVTALALPTTMGQSLSVKYSSSFSPKLTWRSYDHQGQLWFESHFEFWRFDCLDENPSQEALLIQKILQQVRKQNTHFLRDEVDVLVETHLEFPLEWGLGSSSTLIYNIAQWAYVAPFELLFKTLGGSGYDIACAQSAGPILYEKKGVGPSWTLVHFDPPFKNNLFFVYLGNKADSREAIKSYRQLVKNKEKEYIQEISKITRALVEVQTLQEFDDLIREHEYYVAQTMGITPVKKSHFADYWGEVKSLGAWGGDFVLVTSSKSKELTQKYFVEKGFETFFSYDEIIRNPVYPPLASASSDNTTALLQ